MAHTENQCEKCRWFEWARDMNATVPYCNLKHEYEPEICKQYGTLEDVEKRVERLERLCLHMFLHGTWRIGKLISKGPYSAGAISQLDEEKLEVWEGQYEKSMCDLGLWKSEQ